MKKNVKQILFYVALIAAVILICAMLFRESTAEMQYSDVVTAFSENQVESFEIDKNNNLTMTFREGSEFAKNFGNQERKAT